MGEWISVDAERKPNGRCTILVFVKYVNRYEKEDGSIEEECGEEVELGEYMPSRGEGLEFFDSYTRCAGEQWWVTHWMPLPEPPK